MPLKLPRPKLLVPVLLVAAAALFFGGRALMGTKVRAVEAARGDLVQTVVSTGRVISPARVEIGSIVLGTVRTVETKEGTVVKAGQVMSRLRDEEQRAAVEQARGTLAEAEARLSQLARLSAPSSEQALKQAEANLELADEEYKRTRSLFEKGFFSQAKLDEAARNLAVAKATRENALLQAASNSPKGSDYALALARRDQARAALEVAQARLDNTVIKAPAPGTVLKRLVEPGDVVQQGKKLFELSVTGETQVVLNVDEKNIGLLALGQRAQAVADAYPGRTFGAEIFYIAPGVDAQRGTVEVKLRVPEPPDFVRPDMTVSAEILAAKRTNTVTLESDAIRDAAGPAPWVLAVRDGRAVRQPLKLGIRGAGRTEILDGLAASELVVPPSEAAVREGQRVRADTTPAAKKPVVRPPDIFK
ncbi:MAG TPA: efflux RND transporter periplasmic adaptor subunit [Burkholderiales bacterium]|nr:efflux RND transporter periplasmic adaptor subunit [Burkholderiales bacterium]